MHTTDIESLIPQRPPILMVDTFDCEGEGGASSSLLVRQDNIFLSHGSLAAEGLLEHVAQTAAAYVGYIRKLAGEEVNLGYIGDIKRCVMGERMPSVGQTVTTTMKVVSQVANITMISADCSVDNTTVLSCRMKLAN